MIWDKY